MAVIQQLERAGSQQLGLWAEDGLIPGTEEKNRGLAQLRQVQGMDAFRRGHAAHIGQMFFQKDSDSRVAEIVSSNMKSGHRLGAQNKKYRCVMGRLRAGSQVSNWPSARTA
ncbi:hypothetical protein [Polaromonas sp. SM01]|uniref:hypothetical protein n=1 Tax=Polaromonas sp. SM01 TaxID=3085630 RepID=UPI0029820F0F|nr:hypothetical protein [Polaromonas sp. SM01]MDW5442650.1 hypothetical protein [Polaromonas sp. SM01]